MKKKPKLFIFGKKKKKVSEYLFHFRDKNIEIVSHYKYLGLTLTEYLELKHCAQGLSEAGGRALGGIIANFKAFKNIGFSTFSKLYQSGVIPITDYCSGIWGYSQHHYANKVQNRACHYFLSVNKHAPLHAIQDDVGWISPRNRMFVNMIKYYNRLVAMDNDRLTRRLFEYDLQNINNDNWTGELQNIFDQLGFFDNLISGEQIYINECKIKLDDLAHFEWQESISNKPKLRTYVKFKYEIESEDYV